MLVSGFLFCKFATVMAAYLSEEETDDEEAVEAVFFRIGGDGAPAVSDDDLSLEERTDGETGREPEAGPSSTRNDPDFEPEGMFDDDDDDDDEFNVDESESDDDDPVVRAIKEAKHKPKLHPPDIKFSEDIADLSFHPGEDVLAVGSVTGDIFLYKYDLEACELKHSIEVHAKSCRAVEFSEDGKFIASCGKEKSIMITDTETTKLLQFYDNAHDDTPYSLYVFDKNLICSGDESGILKVWDVRQKQAVCRFKVGDESISSMVSDEGGKYLVCAAVDSISSYDMNSRKLFVHSEVYEEELTSMKIFKQGTKLVVGGLKGTLFVFNWGQFGYHSDIYPGLKHPINTTVAVTENILLTGCGDGVLRAAHLFPHKQLGVVGQHKLSIEATDISHDGLYVASCGFDEVVKFWDISYFEDIKVKPEKSKKARDSRNNLPSSQIRNPGDFFSELT